MGKVYQYTSLKDFPFRNYFSWQRKNNKPVGLSEQTIVTNIQFEIFLNETKVKDKIIRDTRG